MLTKFQEKVYKICKKVPKGKVTTYKKIAEKLRTKAYRAIGTALAKNPYAPKVPCHRVVNSNGNIGAYSGKGGRKSKVKMLRKEGIEIKNDKIKNFRKFLV